MKILEIEVDFVAEASWFQWNECSSASMLDSIKAIASRNMGLSDFNDWFEELSDSQQTRLLIEFAVYKHDGQVYFVEDKKFQ